MEQNDDDEPVHHNPLMRRLHRKNKQSKAYRKSPNLEKRLALKVNGRRTLGSGNKSEKADVRRKGIARLEHKATQAKSFSVTRDMLDKVENAALANNEVPAVIIEFLDAQGEVTKSLAVIPMDELIRLLNG